uniref:Uncharacterized protein n=1 Tax=Ursus maritimus TaxID=29073 RepID=A0A452TRX5_URSMA
RTQVSLTPEQGPLPALVLCRWLWVRRGRGLPQTHAQARGLFAPHSEHNESTSSKGWWETRSLALLARRGWREYWKPTAIPQPRHQTLLSLKLLKIRSQDRPSYVELTFSQHIRCECRPLWEKMKPERCGHTVPRR